MGRRMGKQEETKNSFSGAEQEANKEIQVFEEKEFSPERQLE